MKVAQLIEQLSELNPDYEIGLAHDKDGVVEIRAVESDVINEIYRLV